MAEQWDDVVVRRSDSGAVVIEPDGFPTEAIDQAAIPVVGGVLFVDVDRPERPPRALVTDPFWAQTWLPGVYGEPVADRVVLFEDETHTEQTRLPARRDYLSEAVGRLGVGFWLHRWWPTGAADVPEIDERLLELEIGALAWYADALFVDPAPTLALLEPHCQLLVEQVDALRRLGIGTTAETDLGILTTALRAVDDLVSDDVPGAADCRRLLDLLEEESAAVEAAVAAVDWTSVVASVWDQVLAEIPAVELALSPKGGRPGPAARRPVRSGRSTVDPLQVPPRAVRGRRDNLQWQIRQEPDGEIRIEIRVDAGSRPTRATVDSLVARVHVGGPARPVPLSYDAGLRAWVGTGTLDAVPDVDPEIDAFDPAYVHRARVGESGRLAVDADLRRISARIQARAGRAVGVVAAFIAERKAWPSP